MAVKRSEVQRHLARAAQTPMARPPQRSAGSVDPSPFSRREPAPRATPEQIAEAAYYRALARGFEPGQEMSDWLAAERELQSRSRNE